MEAATVTGESDGDNCLVRADPRLLALQRACGGELGGVIAIPGLLLLVEEARSAKMPIIREFLARDGGNQITGRADLRVVGGADGERVCIRISQWSEAPIRIDAEQDALLSREITRQLSECVMRLDAGQSVLSCEADASDLRLFAETMRTPGTRHWTQLVDFADPAATSDDWHTIDGTTCRLRGSVRDWRVYIEEIADEDGASNAQAGFIVYFTAETPLPAEQPEAADDPFAPSLGRDLTPVLRQPVNRIIAHAETMRTKLAGPLADEYRTYAGDIANAGQHLLGLMDDLSDLEVVEAESFATAPDKIDLADVARRACGILGVRAREKGITLVPPAEGEVQPAIAEFRRVLQILLNLVGNAIRYSPEDSQVWVRLDGEGDQAMVTVADQGHGLDAEQQDKVFEKFERLGRSGDNGSGLGLYISRRIAHAMDGDLTVESAPGQGARFTLSVPAAG